METYSECNIFIHSKFAKHIILKQIAVALGIPDPMTVSFGILVDNYTLAIKENRNDATPSGYRNGTPTYTSTYFNIRAIYTGKSPDIQLHINNLSQILEHLWAQKIPAATSGDFNKLLPHQGGNDPNFIFWVDDKKKLKE